MRKYAWFWLTLLCIVILVGCGGSGDDGGGPPVDPVCTTDADCDDGNPCTAGVCDPATGVCSYPARMDGTDCDDGNPCTTGDTCQAGLCTPGACVATGPSDPCCADAACAGVAVCQAQGCTVDADCDDGDPCTANICNQATGVCSNPVRPNGTACDDGNACTSGDTCQAGSCTPGACAATGPADPCCADPACAGAAVCQPPGCTTNADCNDGNPCTDDICNQATGVCSNPARPNGTPCNDGNACTSGDTCQAALCTPGACAATGPADPCCADPACLGAAVCEPQPAFEGGVYIFTVVSMSQAPPGCFLDPFFVLILLGLIGDIPAAVELPPEGDYPALLTLDIPFLGLLEVTARFVNGEIVFDEVDLDPIRVADFAAFLPPELLPLLDTLELWCEIEGSATGSTQGLDGSGFDMNIQIYNLRATEYPLDKDCGLDHTADPSCRMNVTVGGTRSWPPTSP